jgi:hypothetical protein
LLLLAVITLIINDNNQVFDHGRFV